MEFVKNVEPLELGRGVLLSSCPSHLMAQFSATIAAEGDHNCERCAISPYQCDKCLSKSRYDAFVTPTYQKARLAIAESDGKDSHVLGEPQWISLQAFKENLAFTCLFTTCGWANFTRPWIIPAIYKTPTSLSSICARALALGILGLEEMHMESQIEAASLYGTALGMLAHSISKASRKEAAHLLAPVMALTFYTMCVDGTFFTSPRTHYNGLRHIVEYCGPDNFRDESLRPAFEAARVLLTNESLIRRKRTFFEQRDWKVIPWKDPSRKSASNRIFDIIADIPGILEDLDEMNAGNSTDNLTKERVRARIVFLKTQLTEWRWFWNGEHQHVVREVPSNRNPDGIDHPIFKSMLCTMLRFDSIVYAGDILLYNSALLWLMRLESILFPTAMEPSTPSDIEWIQTATSHHPNNPLLLPGEARFFLQPAVEICRSVEDVFARLSVTQDVSMGLALPIAVATSVIEQDKLLMTWLKEMQDAFAWSKTPLKWWSKKVDSKPSRSD